ncbi:MAG: hypothetical protein ABJB55_06750 [Actinomycetota bacterium]
MSKNQPDDQRLTKAERKEQARIEREQIQRKQSSRKRNRTMMLIGGLLLVAAVIGVVVLLGGNDNGPTDASPLPPGVTLPDPATLPGIMQTPPPWSNNIDQLPERLALLSLPQLNDQAGALHHHTRLWVYVDGHPVEVPANIGLSQQAASPLHTHDTAGVVHVESADPNFEPVLGQFMDVWGLYFTQTCLGDGCSSGDRQLRIFLDGQPYTGDPTLLPLTDQAAVVVTMGTNAQLPNPMPDTIAFGTQG